MTDFEIYNEDCLEGMKRIPDGSVDMVLTDPPFGTTDAPWDKPLPPPLVMGTVTSYNKTECGDSAV